MCTQVHSDDDDDDDDINNSTSSLFFFFFFYFSNAVAALPLVGAFGIITPACDNIRLTVSDGCAPTDNQYLILSMFKPTCLCESLDGIGS